MRGNAGTLLLLILSERFVSAKEEVLLAMQKHLPFFLVRPGRHDLSEGFHDVLNHMKMIHDNLSVWQTGSNCWSKGGTHIHADRFHIFRSGKPLEQGDRVFQPTSLTHLKHMPSFQITED